MTNSEASILEVEVAEIQLVFLENRAKELGLSKEELVKWYIVNDMIKFIDAEKEVGKPDKKRISLRGIISGSMATEADFEEAKNIWKPKSP